MKEQKEQKGRAKFIVINLVRVLLVFAFAGAYLNGRWLVLIVSGLAFFIPFLPGIIKRFFGVTVPADIEIIVLLFIYGTLFFGEVRGFYARYWWWEILLDSVAAVALGIVGLTILIVLYKDEQLDASPGIIALFTFCFAFAMGVLWESFEFAMDYFFGFNLLKGSANEIMHDILVDAIGAFVVSVFGYTYLKKGKTNLISKLIVNFIEKNPLLFRAKKPETPAEKIKKIIEKGEKDNVEFKSTLRTNIYTNNSDRKVEHSVLKTMAAFLNSNGGSVLVGVTDKGEVLGIERDNFENEDKFSLHLTNLMKSSIGKDFFHFMKFEIIKIEEGKSVLVIECEKSDKPVFLRINQEEEFFIRNGPSSVRLDGSSLVDCVNRRFKAE